MIHIDTFVFQPKSSLGWLTPCRSAAPPSRGRLSRVAEATGGPESQPHGIAKRAQKAQKYTENYTMV